jgi:methylenetetrahydrofolate dehydrogenase (NADP+)/methenyltetrahydrofolate cyclohydrolase
MTVRRSGSAVAAEIIDGKAIADEIRGEMRERVRGLAERGTIPGLAVVLVGENPASQVYVRMKNKACEEAGMFSKTLEYPSSMTQEELLALVGKLNADPRYHGILVQLPLPRGIETKCVLEMVDPRKDVDCFHPANVGRLVLGEKVLPPCTPAGIREILVRRGIPTRGAHVVVVGRSNIVGRPLANMMSQKSEGADATVTLCHTGTKSIDSITRLADILVAAIGRPEFIQGSMIRKGAVVIDVGVNRVEDPASARGYRLVGDVHFESAVRVAGAITPVPGGVGPLTIAMLLRNTVEAAESQCASRHSRVSGSQASSGDPGFPLSRE